MRRTVLAAFSLAIIALASCATSRTPLPSPMLEVEQVFHRSEVIVRLFDESAGKTHVQCSIYRVLEEEDGGNAIEAKVTDLRLKQTDERGSFIGVYSNNIEFPHGTKVVVLCRHAKSDEPLRGSIRMYYH